MAGRSRRDLVVDVGLVVVSAVGGVLFLLSELGLATEPLPMLVITLDVLLGTAAIVAVWFRRRWPVGVALALLVPMALSVLAQVAAVVALLTVAVHRRAPVALGVAALQVLAALAYFVLRPAPDVSLRESAVFTVLVTAALVGWGMYVRARRQLVASLRERAERAEAEQQLRAEQARRSERARIAREMHDILGHRVTLIALQAGGLEVGEGLAPEERAKAAGLIRLTARQALADLRDVVGVLRAEGDEPAPQGPQPGLGEVAGLVESSREAGARVQLEMRVEDSGALPEPLGRAAYRIVQEALTNVHKHAPGSVTSVRLCGAPGHGLAVRVHNELAGDAVAPWPGGGRGLIGLAERVALAGGTLTHGPDPGGGFLVDARLVWPS